MTGPKDIIIAVLVGLVVAFSVHAVIQKLRMDNLKTTVKVYKEREANWTEELADCAGEIVDLQAALDKKNLVSEENARLGAENERLQAVIDRQARSIASIDRHLEQLMVDQQAFDELVADADTCQTFELALASIAGEIP